MKVLTAETWSKFEQDMIALKASMKPSQLDMCPHFHIDFHPGRTEDYTADEFIALVEGISERGYGLTIYMNFAEGISEEVDSNQALRSTLQKFSNCIVDVNLLRQRLEWQSSLVRYQNYIGVTEGDFARLPYQLNDLFISDVNFYVQAYSLSPEMAKIEILYKVADYLSRMALVSGDAIHHVFIHKTPLLSLVRHALVNASVLGMPNLSLSDLSCEFTEKHLNRGTDLLTIIVEKLVDEGTSPSDVADFMMNTAIEYSKIRQENERGQDQDQDQEQGGVTPLSATGSETKPVLYSDAPGSSSGTTSSSHSSKNSSPESSPLRPTTRLFHSRTEAGSATNSASSATAVLPAQRASTPRRNLF